MSVLCSHSIGCAARQVTKRCSLWQVARPPLSFRGGVFCQKKKGRKATLFLYFFAPCRTGRLYVLKVMTVWHHRQHRFVTLHAKGVSIGSKARALRLHLDPNIQNRAAAPQGWRLQLAHLQPRQAVFAAGYHFKAKSVKAEGLALRGNHLRLVDHKARHGVGLVIG